MDKGKKKKKEERKKDRKKSTQENRHVKQCRWWWTCEQIVVNCKRAVECARALARERELTHRLHRTWCVSCAKSNTQRRLPNDDERKIKWCLHRRNSRSVQWILFNFFIHSLTRSLPFPSTNHTVRDLNGDSFFFSLSFHFHSTQAARQKHINIVWLVAWDVVLWVQWCPTLWIIHYEWSWRFP